MDHFKRKLKDKIREVVWDGIVRSNPQIKACGNPAMVADLLESNQDVLNEVVNAHYEEIKLAGFEIAYQKVRCEFCTDKERK